MKQAEKVLAVMAFNRQRPWFYPPDFMREGMGKYFVGYEASARLSELASRYPDMIESKRKDKYMYRRIKWETIDTWLPGLPPNLKTIVEKSLDRVS